MRSAALPKFLEKANKRAEIAESERVVLVRANNPPKKMKRADIEAAIPCSVCGQVHVDDERRITCLGHSQLDGVYLPCLALPATSGGRCLQCSGQIKLKGTDAHAWRAGHYAQRMPTQLRYVFERAAEGDAMVSMKLQMALIDAREVQLLERLGSEESGELWLTVKGIADELKEAIEAEDATGQAKKLWALLTAVEKGSTEEQQWVEIRDNAEFRRKLSEVERKNQEAERAQMSMEQIGQVASFLGNLLKRYVTDQARLAAAAEELQRYFSGTMAARTLLDDPTIIDAEEVKDAR